MDSPPVRRWLVGAPMGAIAPDQRAIVLNVGQAALSPATRPPLLFHEAMESKLSPAAEVDIWLPPFRGKSMVSLLASLVSARLADDTTNATWHLERQQGPDSVARILRSLGWQDLRKERDGRTVRLRGTPPPTVEEPIPDHFTEHLGERDLTFEADYGVFSPKHVDEGTALLAHVALEGEPVGALADIGIGYGALAISLVANGLAAEAVATDVDSVALWLARRNAESNGVGLTVRCSPDPSTAPPTPLTVCNVPTHIDESDSRALLAGLARRAAHGPVLIVVHRSIEHRYGEPFRQVGLKVARHPGSDHTVFRVTGDARQSASSARSTSGQNNS